MSHGSQKPSSASDKRLHFAAQEGRESNKGVGHGFHSGKTVPDTFAFSKGDKLVLAGCLFQQRPFLTASLKDSEPEVVSGAFLATHVEDEAMPESLQEPRLLAELRFCSCH